MTKKEQRETERKYDQKTAAFQAALLRAKAGKGKKYPDYYNVIEGLNTVNQRYWSGVLQRRKPGGPVDEMTGYAWNIAPFAEGGIIVIVDTEDETSLVLNAKTEGEKEFQTPYFAQIFQEQRKVLMQFDNSIFLQPFDFEKKEETPCMEFEQRPDSVIEFSCISNDGAYLAYTLENGHVFLARTSDGKNIDLQGFVNIKRVYGVECFTDKDGLLKAAMLLNIQDDRFEKNGDPTHALSVFIGDGKKKDRLRHYQTICYDALMPITVQARNDASLVTTGGETKEEGRLEIHIYFKNDGYNAVHENHTIPLNFDQLEKSVYEQIPSNKI